MTLYELTLRSNMYVYVKVVTTSTWNVSAFYVVPLRGILTLYVNAAYECTLREIRSTYLRSTSNIDTLRVRVLRSITCRIRKKFWRISFYVCTNFRLVVFDGKKFTERPDIQTSGTKNLRKNHVPEQSLVNHKLTITQWLRTSEMVQKNTVVFSPW